MIIWILFDLARIVLGVASWLPELVLEYDSSPNTGAQCGGTTAGSGTNGNDGFYKVAIPTGVSEEIYDHDKLMNDELDGDTCIPIMLVHDGNKDDNDPTTSATTDRYARLWCVADSLLYIRVYRDANHDNCMHSDAKSLRPTEPNDVDTTTLEIEGFLPKDVCTAVFTANNPLKGIDGSDTAVADEVCVNTGAMMRASGFDCGDVLSSLTSWPPSDLNMACYGIPTARPTSRPTSRPSSRPTGNPTTWEPTSQPTKNPTSRPPSMAPSMKPTATPTLDPHATPSDQPSLKPSANPSQEPSPLPSPLPTPPPTPPPNSSVPTPPPSSPSVQPHTTNPTIAPTPHPTSAKPTTGAPTMTNAPTITSSPTPPPVSSSPVTGKPTTKKPTTMKPSSSNPTPPPTPPPNSASPTTLDPSPLPTPPPSEFDLAQVTWENIVSRRFAPYCADADILIQYEKIALRALCSWEENEDGTLGGGWASLQSLESCEAHQNQLKANYYQDLNLIPATTTTPFFTTTTTSDQRLYNTVLHDATTTTGNVISDGSDGSEAISNALQTTGDYEHPYTTKKPNFYPRLYAALKCVHGTVPEGGDWMRTNICAEVNSMPLGRMSIASRTDFFAAMKTDANICPKVWLWDLYENMSTDRNNTDTIRDVNKLNVYDSASAKVYEGVTSLCDDHDLGGLKRAKWIEEYNMITKDEEWYQAKLHHNHFHTHDDSRALELPSPATQAGDSNSDYQLIFKFESLTEYEKAGLCKTARSYDESDASDWWAKTKQHHYEDLKYWLKKFGRSQPWNMAAYDAVMHAPRDLLMAFATDPDATKSTCQGNIAFVTDKARVGGDIWNELSMKNYKEYQMKTRYLMKQCWDENYSSRSRKLEEDTPEAWTDYNCESVQSWKQETQIGLDISLDSFYTAIIKCEGDVIGWLKEQYNQQTDHSDAVEYYKKHISDKLEAGQPVMLKKWAYWIFNDADHYHFPCLELARVDAQTRYIDSALRACESLHEVADDSLIAMKQALSGSPMDMTVFRETVEAAYRSDFPETVSGWVAVKKNDNGALESVPLPGLEIEFSGGDNASPASIQQALQDTLEIGVPSADFTATSDNTFIANWFDVTEDEIITKMENIFNMASDGSFALGDTNLSVVKIAFPVQYAGAHAKFSEFAEGKSAAYVNAACVINPKAPPQSQYLKGSATNDFQEADVEKAEGPIRPKDQSYFSKPRTSNQASEDNSSAQKFGIFSLVTAALFMY